MSAVTPPLVRWESKAPAQAEVTCMKFNRLVFDTPAAAFEAVSRGRKRVEFSLQWSLCSSPVIIGETPWVKLDSKAASAGGLATARFFNFTHPIRIGPKGVLGEGATRSRQHDRIALFHLLVRRGGEPETIVASATVDLGALVDGRQLMSYCVTFEANFVAIGKLYFSITREVESPNSDSPNLLAVQMQHIVDDAEILIREGDVYMVKVVYGSDKRHHVFRSHMATARKRTLDLLCSVPLLSSYAKVKFVLLSERGSIAASTVETAKLASFVGRSFALPFRCDSAEGRHVDARMYFTVRVADEATKAMFPAASRTGQSSPDDKRQDDDAAADEGEAAWPPPPAGADRPAADSLLTFVAFTSDEVPHSSSSAEGSIVLAESPQPRNNTDVGVGRTLGVESLEPCDDDAGYPSGSGATTRNAVLEEMLSEANDRIFLLEHYVSRMLELAPHLEHELGPPPVSLTGFS